MVENRLDAVTVLVVDDDSVSRKFIVAFLDSLGVGNVVVADNGVAALDLLKAEEPKVDLIISDVEMPEMGGYELARRIRYGAVPRFKDVPILVLTGNNSERNERMARVHKIDGYVVKSADTSILRMRTVEALGLH